MNYLSIFYFITLYCSSLRPGIERTVLKIVEIFSSFHFRMHSGLLIWLCVYTIRTALENMLVTRTQWMKKQENWNNSFLKMAWRWIICLTTVLWWFKVFSEGCVCLLVEGVSPIWTPGHYCNHDPFFSMCSVLVPVDFHINHISLEVTYTFCTSSSSPAKWE